MNPEQLTLYAIRLKGTDKYLPMREHQYGHSFSEPTSIEIKPPRLFFTEKSVKAALTSWLLGQHQKSRSTDYNGWSGEWSYDECIDIVPQTDRKRENMEIVTFDARELQGHVR